MIQTLGARELGPFLTLIPIAVLAIGLYPPISWWAARRRYYRQSSVTQIFRSVASAGAQIVFGVANSGPAGLIIGSIMGQLAAVGFFVMQLWRKDGRLIAASLSLKGMWLSARNQSAFPKFSMPYAILFAMTTTVMPPLLLAMYFNPTAVGAFWLADRICQMPAVVLGDAVRQVFYQRATAQFNRGEGLLDILTKSTVGLTLVVAVPFLITVLYAPTLFGIVFGEEWTQAGLYARWLVILWLVNLICIPSSTLVPIYGYQRLQLVFECLTQLPRLAVIPLASHISNDVTAIAIYSLTGAVVALCMLVFVILRSWRYQVSLVRPASFEA